MPEPIVFEFDGQEAGGKISFTKCPCGVEFTATRRMKRSRRPLSARSPMDDWKQFYRRLA